MRGDVITLDRRSSWPAPATSGCSAGRAGADRAIRGLTNAPVNHVGMAVALDDLPPLMWHAELGRSLPDMWTGKFQRGVQLHDLRAAVLQWGQRYGQRGWVRQLSGELTREHEDGLLRDDRPAGRHAVPVDRRAGRAVAARPGAAAARRRRRRRPGLGTAYCAEVVALTFVEMGLLPDDHRPSWYDPGRFWSGDDLDLAPGFALGGEIEVVVPLAPDPDSGAARRRRSARTRSGGRSSCGAE